MQYLPFKMFLYEAWWWFIYRNESAVRLVYTQISPGHIWTTL